MGLTCSKDTNGATTGCCSAWIDPSKLDGTDCCRADSLDPVMYDLMRKSLQMTLEAEAADEKIKATTNSNDTTADGSSSPKTIHHVGQYHLLYKHQKQQEPSVVMTPLNERPAESANANSSSSNANTLQNDKKELLTTSASIAPHTVPKTSPYPTRLVVRRRPVHEEGTHGQTHIYAVRYPPSSNGDVQEQAPSTNNHSKQRNVNHNKGCDAFGVAEPLVILPTNSTNSRVQKPTPTGGLQDFFQPPKFKVKHSKSTITEWVTVSEENSVYVVDVGLSAAQCDRIIQITEQVCRGQYAAYTYAKQTLGCREFPSLAAACAPPVQSVVQAILGLPAQQQQSSQPQNLQLDDREPHLVKYDVTKKERQKLDMHTDKSEWTFLIALSNGCGLDYDGGGTYFECLNSTIHIQRGHALVFPGKLRHCGQRITRGLRYLLVGFLVDKANMIAPNGAPAPVPDGNRVPSAAGTSGNS